MSAGIILWLLFFSKAGTAVTVSGQFFKINYGSFIEKEVLSL